MGKKTKRNPSRPVADGEPNIKSATKSNERATGAIPVRLRQRWWPREWMVLLGTALALGIVFFSLTLNQPYHLDTTAYFRSVRELRSGHLTCGYETRCMVSYFLIPFSLFGDHAVKVGFIAAAVLFFVFSYLFLARALSRATGYVTSLLQVSIPAGLVTITHLKEDFVGLMFLALALLLASRAHARWRIVSSIAFAFALLSKEPLLLFTPFYLAVLGYYLFGVEQGQLAQRARRRDTWLWLATCVATVLAVILAIKHDYLAALGSLTNSPHLGQFKGPFSSLLPVGFELYQRGFGLAILFWVQFSGCAVFVLEKARGKRLLYGLFAGNAVLIAFFSMNNTVMSYRNFVMVAFLTLPLAVRALELVVPRRGTVFAVAAAAAAILMAGTKSYAYVAFHARYNTQAHFFGALKDRGAPNAVLLAMDAAGLARHYTGLDTKAHAPDPDDAQAQAFVDTIKRDASKTYYLLPDALAYDSKNSLKTRMQTEFRVASVYEGWFEDYHGMDYGYAPGELQSKLERQTGCRVSFAVDDGDAIDSIVMEQYRYRLECSDGAKTPTYPGYRGRVFPSLMRAQVYQLVAARG